MRDPFLSGQDTLRLTLHAKSQVTKYATWDFLSECSFESAQMPHSGPILNKKSERSYNPKRFSSSSLMIFNAFTRA